MSIFSLAFSLPHSLTRLQVSKNAGMFFMHGVQKYNHLWIFCPLTVLRFEFEHSNTAITTTSCLYIPDQTHVSGSLIPRPHTALHHSHGTGNESLCTTWQQCPWILNSYSAFNIPLGCSLDQRQDSICSSPGGPPLCSHTVPGGPTLCRWCPLQCSPNIQEEAEHPTPWLCGHTTPVHMNTAQPCIMNHAVGVETTQWGRQLTSLIPRSRRRRNVVWVWGNQQSTNNQPVNLNSSSGANLTVQAENLNKVLVAPLKFRASCLRCQHMFNDIRWR